MKILLLDIETAPNLAYVWGLFKETINIDQIANSGYVLCWSAKWLGERNVHFSSLQHTSSRAMLAKVHRLLNQADAVVHYNGKAFDIPTLNKEFVTHHMKPPSPYKQVDLLQVVRAEFAFPSKKLDYVAQTLGLGKKIRHPGFQMWVRCMRKDPLAWRAMEAYNRRDVAILEKLYNRLLPWIRVHPNHGTFVNDTVCPNCGEKALQSKGLAATQLLLYRRYVCKACGFHCRGNRTVTTNRDRRVSIAP